ncbi:hypothetical protein BKA62DRAFT_192621 [Auriculariales sp. MPI-PUGE-AT-0066]|nr:hypothetical protein BKA62DRAFT_192621 [Auriculariales sp. MPI-PUGE-AT-0066]
MDPDPELARAAMKRLQAYASSALGDRDRASTPIEPPPPLSPSARPSPAAPTPATAIERPQRPTSPFSSDDGLFSRPATSGKKRKRVSDVSLVMARPIAKTPVTSSEPIARSSEPVATGDFVFRSSVTYDDGGPAEVQPTVPTVRRAMVATRRGEEGQKRSPKRRRLDHLGASARNTDSLPKRTPSGRPPRTPPRSRPLDSPIQLVASTSKATTSAYELRPISSDSSIAQESQESPGAVVRQWRKSVVPPTTSKVQHAVIVSATSPSETVMNELTRHIPARGRIDHSVEMSFQNKPRPETSAASLQAGQQHKEARATQPAVSQSNLARSRRSSAGHGQPVARTSAFAKATASKTTGGPAESIALDPPTKKRTTNRVNFNEDDFVPIPGVGFRWRESQEGNQDWSMT